MLPDKTDVAVIGAGPTGLALAIRLQRAGVDHVLIDRLQAGQNTSRAAVIHAHTLEALEELGVADELIGRGLRLHRFAIRDRDRTLLRLRFDRLPSRHPYLLMLPQDVTEAVLGRRLEELGGQVRRGLTATVVTESADEARLTVSNGEGEAVLTAGWVVGADGMHSLVREAAGIGFSGQSDEASFVLADVAMDWPLGRDEVSLFFAPDGLVVVAPLPGDRFRIVATLEEAPPEIPLETVQTILEARGPRRGPIHVREIVWSSRFRVHHRLAETYRRGRLILMGDAAHVHSPAGGQGMNTGVLDATLLGDCLVRVLADGAPAALLDSYGQLRRKAAAEVLALAGRLTGMATMRAAPARLARNAGLSLLDQLPPAKRRLQYALSGVSRRSLSRLDRANTPPTERE